MLELHADDVTCGLFRLTGAVNGIPRPTEDETYHRDRDEKTLLLQTSGTRSKTLHIIEIKRDLSHSLTCGQQQARKCLMASIFSLKIYVQADVAQSTLLFLACSALLRKSHSELL